MSEASFAVTSGWSLRRTRRCVCSSSSGDITSFRLEVAADRGKQRLRVWGYSSRPEQFVQSVDGIFPYQDGCVKHSYTEKVVVPGQDLGVVRSNVVCLVRVPSDSQMTALPGAVSRIDGSVVTRVDTLGKITGGLDENFEDVHDSDGRFQYDCSI